MGYDEKTAERVRRILSRRRDVVEGEAVASVHRASGRVTGRAPGETAVLATGAYYGRLGGLRLVVKAATP